MRLKYNALAANQVLFSLIFFYLLAASFGAGKNSDSFLIAFSIISSIQLLQLMFIEQFLYFFQQKKAESVDSSISFYQNSLLFSLFVGFTFYLIFSFFGSNFIELFNYFSDKHNPVTKTIESVFSVLVVGLIIYPLSYVNDRVLNAEKKFALPYISETMPYILMVFSFLVFEVQDEDIKIEDIAVYKNIGMLIGFVFTTLVLSKLGFFRKNLLRLDASYYEFIKNSFYMRFAHNINNFGVTFIANAFLVTLEPGLASIYHYALRGVIVVKQVIVGPFYRVFQSEMSSAFYRKEFSLVKVLISSFYVKSIIAYILFVFIGWLLIEPALILLAPQNLQINTFDEIAFMFLLIGVWHLFMVAELARVSLYMAAKDYRVFLFMNLFIVLTLFMLVSHYEGMELDTFVVVNGFLQLISFIFYNIIFNRKLHIYERRSFN